VRCRESVFAFEEIIRKRMKRFGFAVAKIDNAWCAFRVSSLASARDLFKPITAG
jgi:hypothetical protein